MNLREQILGAADVQSETVTIPEWGNAVVVVRGMTAAERDDFETAFITREGEDKTDRMRNIRARLAVACTYTPEGEKLFQPGDEAALGGKAAKAVSRIFDVAQRLNGLTKEDVKELEGNS